MLIEFTKKLLSQAAQNVTLPPNSPPLGTVDAISQLPTPLYGEIDGIGQVTILADGNMIGFSPVQRCVDSQHEQAWVPLERVRATDPRVAPIGGFGPGARTLSER